MHVLTLGIAFTAVCSINSSNNEPEYLWLRCLAVRPEAGEDSQGRHSERILLHAAAFEPSKLSIQGVPNRSMNMAKRSAQNVSSGGIITASAFFARAS